MTAEILSVGTEILLGDILNTNARFLSEELAKLGVNVYWQTVVGDNRGRLLAAYGLAFERGADLVIATGGLGPTEDDLTKETAAEYFGRKLVLHEESWERMLAHFRGRQMPPNNKKQAMLPEGAAVLANNNGTAPGCALERDGKMIVLLPGPPNEMEPMFLESVLPLLRPRTDHVLFSRTLKIVGVGESQAEILLKLLMDRQTNPTMALYAKTSEVWLRLTAAAPDEAAAKELIKPAAGEARRILGGSVYGEDGDTLAGAVVGLLRQRGLTIALAESCTGGALTSALVDVPGASEALLEGLVTYSNRAKAELLGVRAETLEKFGAVSEQTAREMAEGVRRASGASIGAATTGIAGPGGGTPEKPVGLVYITVSTDGKTEARECLFAGNRRKIRDRAVVTALDMVRKAAAGYSCST
ncbi:MAG: competence/damage-inducible protein A [Firmicutes bacterium]|nr:competence/damage-inducible protein A [Bacillota bacterium]